MIQGHTDISVWLIQVVIETIEWVKLYHLKCGITTGSGLFSSSSCLLQRRATPTSTKASMLLSDCITSLMVGTPWRYWRTGAGRGWDGELHWSECILQQHNTYTVVERMPVAKVVMLFGQVGLCHLLIVSQYRAAGVSRSAHSRWCKWLMAVNWAVLWGYLVRPLKSPREGSVQY